MSVGDGEGAADAGGRSDVLAGHQGVEDETSRTIVLDDPRRARTVFEQLLAGNLHPGRPGHTEVIFGRKVTSATPGSFSARVLNRPDQVTVNFSFKHSRIKIYLKEDRALRVETVCNDPADLGCKRDRTACPHNGRQEGPGPAA